MGLTQLIFDEKFKFDTSIHVWVSDLLTFLVSHLPIIRNTQAVKF